MDTLSSPLKEVREPRIDSSGRVGVGTTNPTSKLHVADGTLNVSGVNTTLLAVEQGTINSTGDGRIFHRSFYNNGFYTNDVARFAHSEGHPQVAVFANYFNGNNIGAEVSIIRSKTGAIGSQSGGGGSVATPGEPIGGIKFGASISNQVVQAGFFGAFVSDSGTFSDTSKPTDFRFYTNPNGAIVPTEKVRITSEGNLGIGVTDPVAKLEVNVGSAVTALDIQGSAGQLFSVTNNLTSGSIFSVNDVSGIPSIDVDADGTIQLAPFSTTEMVGVGTTNPTTKLHVVGEVTATDFNSTSDAKLKTNVQVIDDPLAKVLQINGVSFNWVENNKPSMGVIADNIEEVLPELVSDTDPKTVNYNGLIGLLIEVVKDQQTQINSLNERLSQLE